MGTGWDEAETLEHAVFECDKAMEVCRLAGLSLPNSSCADFVAEGVRMSDEGQRNRIIRRRRGEFMKGCKGGCRCLVVYGVIDGQLLAKAESSATWMLPCFRSLDSRLLLLF
ncbi:hypothetical protein GOBAR_DD19082 [Gossypium barbadense]|nr:hypothetical protein GOBAR_DD19082 [Gossypium barbadense]